MSCNMKRSVSHSTNSSSHCTNNSNGHNVFYSKARRGAHRLRLLVLGSKEYPLGTNQGEDPITSGGIEFYNEALVGELARRGDVDVTVITRRFSGAAQLDYCKNIKIHRVPWRQGFWSRTPTFCWNSFRLARRLDCDAILAHGPIATFFGIFLAKMKRVPLVSIPHGLASAQPQYSAFKTIGVALEKWAYSKPDAVIALSSNDVQRLNALNPAIRTKLIPTGIAPDRYTPRKTRSEVRKELGISQKATIIIANSRLSKVKGLNYLLASLPRLHAGTNSTTNTATDIITLLISDGPEAVALKQQAKELGLASRVRFLGFRTDVADLLCASDIFVLPSLSEGLPLSLLEGMATGKPCVVTDIGLPIADGKTGLVVPPADVGALASALQRLIDDKPLRKRLGGQASRVARAFTWSKTASTHIELLKNLQR